MILADKKELLQVLDENGNGTNQLLDRGLVHKNLLWHDEVACIVINNKKQILLQRRSKNKKSYPGCWGLCAGHVVGYQPIKEAILTEINEELIMEIKEKDIFLLVPRMKNEREDNRCFATCFCAIINKPEEDFLIQKEEIDEIKWFSFEEFRNMVKSEENCIFKNNAYYQSIIKALEELFNSKDINKIYNNYLEQIEECDENGNTTGKLMTREFAHNFGIWHRAASIFLINDNNEVLMQKRSKNKIRNAGLWDISVSGHMLYGEDVANTLLRETEEEVNYQLDINNIEFLLKYKESRQFNEKFIDNTVFFVYVTKVKNTDGLRPEFFEVKDLKFISVDELKKMMETYAELSYRPEAYDAVIKYIENSK